jgi:hypothetical protein
MSRGLVSQHYNFYNLIKLRIVSEKKNYLNFFNHEYFFSRLDQTKEDKGKECDIEMIIVREFKASQDLKKVIPIKKNILNILEIEALIGFSDQGNIRVYIKRPWIDRFYPQIIGPIFQSQLIEPLLYYRCLLKGYLMLHAAGVSNGKYSYIFPAPGGTGKTTLSLLLANQGWVFLGDDLIIVSPEGETFAFPKPLHLFSYVTEGLGFLHLSGRQKLIIQGKNVLRKVLSVLLQKKLYLAARMNIRDIVPKIKIGTSFPLKKVIFLNKEGRCQGLDIANPAIRADLINKLIESSDFSKVLFLDILPYSGMAKVDEMRKVENDIMRRVLEQADELYEFSIDKNRDNMAPLIKLLE